MPLSNPSGGTIPAGAIVMWHGTIANIPKGWVICDGTHSTPNLIAKFVQGVATAGTNPGATGGEATHVLSIPEMPSHKHQLKEYAEKEASSGTKDIVYSLADFKDSGLIGNTGGGGAHENKPPFYDIAFIMKS
ncbi:unnamed protein product [marine sediment metagenome]|uniref:Phage tail collar domain-containing protein n=1 Tax=marine sediment metagenome TaxID=412755 RepID=X1KYJ4_9ZZZZ